MRSLSIWAKDAAEKLGPWERGAALGFQQKWCPRRGLRAGEGRLIVFDGLFDSAKVGSDGWYRVLLQPGRVAVRCHIEVAAASVGDRRARCLIHVFSGQTSLADRKVRQNEHRENQNE